MTHAARTHEALEARERIDSLTDIVDRLRDVAKAEEAREAELAEARLLLGMALDVIKRGTYHPSIQHQVAGVRNQIKRALP